MDTDKEKNLCYLEELSDYKVKNDDKDVRGWEVKDKDGRIIGTVDNLLVNKATERTVYLDVEVNESIIEANYKPFQHKANDGVHGVLNEDGENHLIIPIGLVHLNLESELVFTESVNHKTFAEAKRIKKGTQIDRDYEVLVLTNLNPYKDVVVHPKGNAFYDRVEFYSNS